MGQHALMETPTKYTRDQRTFTRVPYRRTVAWIKARGEYGESELVNLSRSGFRGVLDRYLRPGRAILFSFDDVPFRGKPIKLMARIVWCRPIEGNDGSFEAGFSLVHEEPKTLAMASEIFYAALREFHPGGMPEVGTCFGSKTSGLSS